MLTYVPLFLLSSKLCAVFFIALNLTDCLFSQQNWGFPGGSDDTEDLGSIPGSGRSPGEGKGNPLQYCCLENSMDGGAWWATIHEVVESDMIEQVTQ